MGFGNGAAFLYTKPALGPEEEALHVEGIDSGWPDTKNFLYKNSLIWTFASLASNSPVASVHLNSKLVSITIRI